MDYISTQEAAQNWGISLRHVQRLLQENRIIGAKKYGNYWMIPKGSIKPEDLRKQKTIPPQYLRCVFLSFVTTITKNDSVITMPTLTDHQQQAQFQAEQAYLRGEFDAVKRYYTSVSTSDTTYFCAANIAVCAAMSTKDYPLFKQIAMTIEKMKVTATTNEARQAAALFSVLTTVSMNAPKLTPEWLRSCDFSSFSLDSLPALTIMRVKYLQSIRDYSGMLAAAQMVLALYEQKNTFTLTDIYLTCLCACATYALGRTEETKSYLMKCIALCEKCNFLSPLAEYAPCFGGLLEEMLKNTPPAFEKAVLVQIETTLKNWLFFHNEFTHDNVSLILTAKEYQLAVLLKEGKTYQQAAKQLNLSVGRVKNLISIIYEKLGITKKAEITQYVY